PRATGRHPPRTRPRPSARPSRSVRPRRAVTSSSATARRRHRWRAAGATRPPRPPAPRVAPRRIAARRRLPLPAAARPRPPRPAPAAPGDGAARPASQPAALSAAPAAVGAPTGATAGPRAGDGTRRTDPAVLAKPPVRKLAKDLGVDLSAVAATGPGGIVTREDVLAHSERSGAEELATYPGDD